MTMLNAPVDTLQDFLIVTRRLSGHSTRSIGEVIGVSSPTISNWERGKGEPNVSQFVAWCVETKQPLDRVAEGLLKWCAPRDLNPEPIVSGLIGRLRAAFWARRYARRES